MSKIRQHSMYSYQLHDNSQNFIASNSPLTLIQRRNNVAERKSLSNYRDRGEIKNFSKINEVYCIFDEDILHVLKES